MQDNTTPTYPGHTPAKKRRWIAPTAIGAAALLIGVGIGTSSQPEPEKVMVDRPVEVEKIVTETKEVEVEVPVEVSPAACITYIELADSAIMSASTVIGIQGETLGIAGDMIGNPYLATDATVQQIEDNTALIEAETAHLDSIADEINASRDACEAARGDDA